MSYLHERATTEQSTPIEKTINPESKNHQVMQALAASIQGGLNQAEYHVGDSPFIDTYVDFLSTAQQDTATVKDTQKVASLVKLGVLLLDSLIVDELAPFSHEPLPVGKNIYGRSGVDDLVQDLPIFNKYYKSLETKKIECHSTILTQAENTEFNRLISKNKGQSIFGSYLDYYCYLSQSKQDPNYGSFYISQPLTLAEFQKEKALLLDQNLPKTFALEFTVTVGSFYLHLTTSQQSGKFSVSLMSGAPNQTVPRADLWTASINEGQALFDCQASSLDTAPTTFDWSTVYDHLIDLYHHDSFLPNNINRRKYTSYLRHPDSLPEIMTAAKKHYAKDFSSLPPEITNVVLTRSGTSANMLGCYIAADYVGGQLNFGSVKAQCFLDPDFYFENEYPLNDSNFETTADFDKANLFALSADINTPRENQEDFLARRQQVLDSIIQKAHSHPLNNYGIVFNKTANPAACLITPSDLPPNLKVVETMSSSKHQRGSRHAFYGVVLSDIVVKPNTMATFENQALSAPTEYNVVTFPHLTKAETLRTIDRNHHIFDEISKEMEKVPNREQLSGWKLVPANYCLFIVPPVNYWHQDSRVAIAYCKNAYYSEMSLGKVEVGDSYGTSRTRLATFITRNTYKYTPKVNIFLALGLLMARTPQPMRLFYSSNGSPILTSRLKNNLIKLNKPKDLMIISPKLIIRIEKELDTKIIQTTFPPQGMTSAVFIVRTLTGEEYAVKSGDQAQDDLPILKLISLSKIAIPVPKIIKSFVFEECPVVIQERIAYPLLESVPTSEIYRYLPSMVSQLKMLHTIKSNKPGLLNNLNNSGLWKDIIMAIFDGTDFNWEEISNRKCLDKNLVLTSVSRIIDKIGKSEFIKQDYSLLHTDFNQRNLFVNPITHQIAGIIDWGEALFGDPIYDFARIRMLIWHFGLPLGVLQNYRKLTDYNLEQIKREDLYWLTRVIQYLAWYSDKPTDFDLGRINLHQEFLRNYHWHD